MSKQPTRRVAKKDDLDLTPPEEIRARRIRRFVLLGALAACVLGVAIYFAARPVGGVIKAWQSRRLAREAFALIDQKKWSEANAKARDAYFLRPTEPETWRAFARLAARTNQWTAALEWWKKLDENDRLTVEDRREFVGAALITGDLPVAEKQVEALLAQQGGPAPIDIVFAGQVASRQNNPLLALDYAQRALADKRAKSNEIMAATTLVLSVTNRSSQPYATAWKQLEDVARDPKNPSSLNALTLLAQAEALPPLPPIASQTSLSLESIPAPTPTPVASPPSVAGGDDAGSKNAGSAAETGSALASPDSTSQSVSQPPSHDTLTLTLAATPPPAPPGRTISLTEVANALENHPDAGPFHKLLALEVRARQDPALADEYVRDAIKRFGNGDDKTVAALVAWLNRIGRPAKTLEILPQALAVQRQELFVQYINALAALQRWSDIKDLLVGEHSALEPVYQHMYLAVAQTHLGSATAAINEWQRALQVANTADKLLALAIYAEQNSASDTADAAYSEAIKRTPQNRTPYAGRLRIALTVGDTAKAQKIAAEIAQVWPDDDNARNQDAYLRLLLGASGDAVEAAERDARLLVKKEPRNWQARATLGLACLLLGRKEEALAAIREPRVTGSEPPGALAVRVAILAANGFEEGARNDAQLVSANPLLPEERALIAPLLQ